MDDVAVAKPEENKIKKIKPKKEETITLKKDTIVQILGIALAVSLLFNALLLIRPTQERVVLQTPTIPSTTIKSSAQILSQDKDNTIMVLTDSKCAACDVTQLADKLRQVFPSYYVLTLDYDASDTQKTYADAELTELPAVLMPAKIKSDANFNQVAPYILDTPNGLVYLRVGGAWDPYCDRDTTHCGDDKCKGRTSCRLESPQTLDLFVMSRCPFGVQALDSLKEVLTTFPSMKLNINYIGGGTKGSFSSLHGASEVTDDILELCAMKYYPENFKYMDFIWCRNKDFNADWQKCATDNGMDAAKIKTCYDTDDGASLLAASFKKSTDLGIGASPSWIVNNKYPFSGLDSQTIKSNYCVHNDVAGCDKTLSSSTGGVPANGGCG